jgi:hypothetical protein
MLEKTIGVTNTRINLEDPSQLVIQVIEWLSITAQAMARGTTIGLRRGDPRWCAKTLQYNQFCIERTIQLAQVNNATLSIPVKFAYIVASLEFILITIDKFKWHYQCTGIVFPDQDIIKGLRARIYAKYGITPSNDALDGRLQIVPPLRMQALQYTIPGMITFVPNNPLFSMANIKTITHYA